MNFAKPCEKHVLKGGLGGLLVMHSNDSASVSDFGSIPESFSINLSIIFKWNVIPMRWPSSGEVSETHVVLADVYRS